MMSLKERRARLRLGLAAAVGVSAGAMLSVAPAYAVVPACGSTITTSIVLTGDILNCPATALRVNASNVTIDLNGHTIDGPGPTQNGPSGVVVTQGNSNVTVKNGRIQEFAFGVGLGTGTSGADVTGLTLIGNGSGVAAVSTVMGVFAVTDNNHIHGNQVVNNQFQGIALVGSGNWIEGNSITDSQNGIRVGAGGAPASNGNRVESNRLDRARILINNAPDTVVLGNQVVGSPLTGILVVDSPRTIVSSNEVVANGDGIGVQGSSAGTVVSDNTAYNSADDGIDIATPNVTVARNVAYQNRDYGIAAVAGTIDGGGNRASANGNPQQCTPNIVCTP